MRSKLEKRLGDYLTVGPSDDKKKWADGLTVAIAVLGSLILFIYSWTQRSNPAFDEKGLVAGLGLAGAFGLLTFLLCFIFLTVKLIHAGIRALIKFIIIQPAKNTWKLIISFTMNSWLIKQVIRIGKRWLAWWEYIGFETSIKPFLSYLEPELEPPISNVTELTQLHLDEKYNDQEFIQNVIARYQRLGTVLALPWITGWFVLTFLPGTILLPVLSKVSPYLSNLYIYFFIFIWIPACLGGFWALIGAILRRQHTWRKPLWELMKQEYVDQLADSVNLEAQSTLQERIDTLRSTYQRELRRYRQLEQDARSTEHSIDWINRLSREEQNSALRLFEMQHQRIQEEVARREKAQLPKRTVRDFAINVAAGLFGALLAYAIGLCGRYVFNYLW